MLGFDDYPDIAARLRSIVAGEAHHPHTPQDRRRLLPISPVERDASALSVPGHARRGLDELGVGAPATGPRAVRRRLDGGPMAPLKLASGCDRRCSFCAIPASAARSSAAGPATCSARRGGWPTQGVRELFLVSENSTSYGKDLGDLRLLETLLPELGRRRRHRAGAGLLPAARRDPSRPGRGDRRRPRAWRRTSTSPSSTPAPTVLRRMRRFGDPESFLGLLEQIRAPRAGGRRAVQRDRRLPRRDRGRPADPVRLPGRGPDGRHRRLRLLRRGRHRGRVVRRQARRGRGPRPRRARHRAGRGAQRPAGRGAHRRGRRGAGRVAWTTARRRGPRRPPGPRGRRHAPCSSRCRPAPRSATSCTAEVVATDGVDLVARATGERR